jgi:hypothetical protein
MGVEEMNFTKIYTYVLTVIGLSALSALGFLIILFTSLLFH